eukprot:TRINITY_DN10378_c0_g1_i1.p1 TRINITY_DN10378_c0_g1~~TRINITY_DN10378_c0_g1_i1.p1  ORF type:complete len:200 (+),score=40.41 TRINITY_DN10378_c0_g1_i1:87-686(+)
MEAEDATSLGLLIRSPTRDAVVSIVEDSFKNRHKKNLPVDLVQSVASTLSKKTQTSEAEASALIKAIQSLISRVLYQMEEDIEALFPSSFQPQLKQLIAKVISDHVQQWRRDAISNQVALPRLQHIDWRMDIKSASERGRMSVPTVLVQLEVTETRKRVDQDPQLEKVTFEVGKSELDTMLEGLGRIRDQLNAVASSKQ